MIDSSGFVLIDKPEGITSSDLVLKVKKLKKLRKIGHTGTLDKFACGLMILPFGDYTSFSSHFLGQDKLYETFIRFGKSTDSGDRDGVVLESWEDIQVKEFFQSHEEKIQQEISSISTWKSQVAPLVSALKVKGKRQAELFRMKIDVEAKTREIEISELKILELTQQGVRLSLRVSSGTYIRKIAIDLGKNLGLPMFVSYLCRREIGKWKLENAIQLSSLENSVDKFPGIEMVEIQKVSITPEEAKNVRYGKYISISEGLPSEFLFFQGEELVAWCERNSEKSYIYKKVFI